MSYLEKVKNLSGGSSYSQKLNQIMNPKPKAPIKTPIPKRPVATIPDVEQKEIKAVTNPRDVTKIAPRRPQASEYYKQQPNSNLATSKAVGKMALDTLQAPSSLLLNTSKAAVDLTQGKKPSWTNNYTYDQYLTDVNDGQNPLDKISNPVLKNTTKLFAEAAVDPLTYVGGGIIDDLARSKALKAGTSSYKIAEAGKQSSNVAKSFPKLADGNPPMQLDNVTKTDNAIETIKIDEPFENIAGKAVIKRNNKPVEIIEDLGLIDGKRYVKTDASNVAIPVERIATEKQYINKANEISSKVFNDVTEAQEALKQIDKLEKEAKAFDFNIQLLAEPKKKIQEAIEGFAPPRISNPLKSNVINENPEIEKHFRELAEGLEGTASKSDPFITKIASTIKDKKTGLGYGFTDIYRNLENAFGNNYKYVKEKVLDPFDRGKKAYVDMQRKYLNDLKTNVTDMGIQKNSKLSKAVQEYGEKQRIVGFVDEIDPTTGQKVKKLKTEFYTEEMLKQEFPNDWQKVVKADKWFRKSYDELIDQLNESRKQIYPSVEKQIKEVEERINGLRKEIKQTDAERFILEQGRPYKTTKEININSQINRLQKRIENYKSKLKNAKKNDFKEKLKTNIESLEKQAKLKNEELKKANLYAQPTLKKFKKTEDKLTKLNELLSKKEKLLKSDVLWRNKRIPKRDDYYRHFREMSDSFAGAKNLFDTPSQIDPSLAGISEFTKPNSKFLGLAQARGKGAYKADAVEGFLDYIKAAAYGTHIDPHIIKFRQLGKDIAEGTAKSKNANKLIEYLSDYANDLAGKTNPFDRTFQKIFNRQTFRTLNTVNSRIKSNTVLGNLSSSMSQIANVPQGIAKVKDPQSLAKGFQDFSGSLFGKGHAKLYDQSQFISERYIQNAYSQFDTRLIDQPKKFAAWALGALDEVGTKFIWSSVYEKALKQGIKNPIKHADDVTRKLVAGRGVGELALYQKAKTTQLVAPFQVEVANLWNVQKDFTNDKDFGGLAILYLANFALNKAFEQIRGNGVVFDPIQATIEALENEDKTPLTVAGRLGGEVLSNMPFGQTLASIYPEYGKQIGDYNLPARREFFGEGDPSRFGSGILASKGTQDPLFKLLPPWGGNQLKKTLGGAKATQILPELNPLSSNFLQKQPISGNIKKSKDGEKLRFPIEKTPTNTLKALTFGPNSTSEARKYYGDKLNVLGTEQTKAFEYAINKGVEPKAVYGIVQDLRKLKPQAGSKGVTKNQKINVIKKSNLTDRQKKMMIALFIDTNLRKKLLGE